MVKLLLGKKGGESLGSWQIYIIIYSFIFLVGIGFAVLFTGVGYKVETNFNDIEGSVIGTRVIDCLSENEFGVISKDLFNENYLKSCYDFENKYNIELNLIDFGSHIIDADAMLIGHVDVSLSDKKYYVLTEEDSAILNLRWNRVI